jgi:hypothetical protein
LSMTGVLPREQMPQIKASLRSDRAHERSLSVRIHRRLKTGSRPHGSASKLEGACG